MWRYVRLSKQVLGAVRDGGGTHGGCSRCRDTTVGSRHTGGDVDGFLFSVSILAGDDGFPLAAVMLDQNLAVVFLLTVF